MLKAGTLRIENPGVVLPALLDLGIYPSQAGNGGKNLEPGCVFEVSCGALWGFIKAQRTRCLWGCQQGCPLSPLNLKSALSTRDRLLSQFPPKASMSSGASLAQKSPKIVVKIAIRGRTGNSFYSKDIPKALLRELAWHSSMASLACWMPWFHKLALRELPRGTPWHVPGSFQGQPWVGDVAPLPNNQVWAMWKDSHGSRARK